MRFDGVVGQRPRVGLEYFHHLVLLIIVALILHLFDNNLQLISHFIVADLACLRSELTNNLHLV